MPTVTDHGLKESGFSRNSPDLDLLSWLGRSMVKLEKSMGERRPLVPRLLDWMKYYDFCRDYDEALTFLEPISETALSHHKDLFSIALASGRGMLREIDADPLRSDIEAADSLLGTNLRQDIQDKIEILEISYHGWHNDMTESRRKDILARVFYAVA